MFVRISRYFQKFLPDGAKLLLKPLYRPILYTYYLINIVAGTNYFTYEYKNEMLHFWYTMDTADKFRRKLNHEEVAAEGVPFDLIKASTKIDAFIDIGAYHGLYTIIGARMNPESDVYAFEPDDTNREVLRDVLEENDVQAEVRSEVVRGYSGTTAFFSAQESREGHSIKNNSSSDVSEKECLSISEFINEQKHLSSVFIKIDAEGAEEEILPDLFENANYSVEGLVEFHPDKMNENLDRMIDVLNSCSTYTKNLSFGKRETPGKDLSDKEKQRPLFYFRN